jgi:uncharacterized protein (DUF1684 family)
MSVVAAAACSPQPPEEGDYLTQVTAARAYKDKQFEQTDDPVPANRKAALLPLLYYPVDPAYNVPAELKPSNDPTVIDMLTSTGELQKYRRAGTLQFTVNGQQLGLTAFVDASASNLNHLFVPFSDSTSGTDTYPAGRYLELQRTATGFYELDFNRAFNPYCYYNLTYSCPLPPVENQLKLPILAGEKIKGKS